MLASQRPRRRLSPLRLALVAAILAGTSQAAEADAPWTVALRDPLDGGTVELSPGGRVLHVVLFATWCPPCVDELDRLAALESRWQGRGYDLVLVAVRNRQSTERLAAFARERRLPGRLLFDAEGRAADALGGSALPGHVVFDAAGTERARSSALDDTIESALAEAVRAGERRKAR